jgi:hypothetical protein
MKQLTFIFLALIALVNCSNKKISISDNNINDISLIDNNIDGLKQNFLPIINGIWVLTDYINEIEKTKSPIKSRHKLDGIVTMVIDAKNQSDSIKVGASWNNHEGYEFVVYFQTGQNSHSLKTDISNYYDYLTSYELGYETINNEDYLFLYRYNNKNELIGKMQFSKVANHQQNNDAAWGLQYIVNKILLSGEFLLIDSANIKTQIKFNNDGSLIGFQNFDAYYIITDYLGDPVFLDVDMINFKNEKHDFLEYAFKINNDTIYFYSVIAEEETGLPFELDELKYKLVRK